MWKSGGIQPQLDLSRGRTGKAAALRSLRLLLMLGVVYGTIFLIFPLVFEPKVEPPAQPRFNNPLSMSVRISNLNPFTPLTDVEYSCEISKLTLTTGADVASATTLIRGSLRRFEGRSAISAPCETAYGGKDRITGAEYKLTLSYRIYPWPSHRTNVYLISAQIDANGNITGWSLG